MNNKPLGPKDPAEVKVIRFPFGQELDGVAIASVQSVVARVKKGADANPGQLLAGAASVVGTDVLQRVQGGVSGVVYEIRVTVADVNSNVHVIADTLAVDSL